MNNVSIFSAYVLIQKVKYFEDVNLVDTKHNHHPIINDYQIIFEATERATIDTRLEINLLKWLTSTKKDVHK